MFLTYYYSACVGITTPDFKILSDPWFTDGIYEGSWYQYPPVRRPVEMLGAYDFIYISHIHADHYDPIFLRHYLAVYPACEILIGNFPPPNVLASRMRGDAIPHRVVDELTVGSTSLKIFVNGRIAEDATYDSALVVRCNGRSIVNMNDNVYDADQVAGIKQFAGDIRIALLPYLWATNSPQCFFDKTDADFEDIRKGRLDSSLSAYLEYVEVLQPHRSLPFAGKYWLGGRLAPLNELRAVLDPVEVRKIDPGAFVLADHGKGQIDSDTLEVTGERTEPYKPQAIAAYVAALSRRPHAYDRLVLDVPDFGRAVERLLRRAYRAIRTSPPEGKAPAPICLRQGAGWLVLDFAEDGGVSRRDGIDSLLPRCEVDIDPRYLFGLLAGLFHWNSAELGCHYQVRHFPRHQPVWPVLKYLSRLRVW